MVEVFKTSINNLRDAEEVLIALYSVFPQAAINFDLEDVDNILRVEQENGMVNFDKVIATVESSGFAIEVLEDDQPVVELR